MDRIDALHVFVRVVESGSFSKAARDLGLANLERLRPKTYTEAVHLGVEDVSELPFEAGMPKLQAWKPLLSRPALSMTSAVI